MVLRTTTVGELEITNEIRRAPEGAPDHLVVEGENLDVRKWLEASGERVDMIYIDPPYSTGHTDKTFADRFGDWAVMLRPRLELARKLLTKTGHIVIAVDELHLCNLRVLCDEVFGKSNYLSTLVWQGGVKSPARFGGAGQDFMVSYGRSKTAMFKAGIHWREPKEGVDRLLEAAERAFTRAEYDSAQATEFMRAWWKGKRNEFAPGLREYSRIDERGRLFRIGPLAAPVRRGAGAFDVLHPRTGLPVKPPPGEWVAAAATIERWVAEGRILFGEDETTTPYRKLFLGELGAQVPAPTFVHRRGEATKHLRKLIGEHEFANPKDVGVLVRWFRIMASSDAAVLDFFGGSGTTAEVVMRLNVEDGGSRRAVVVTNNEVATPKQVALEAAGFKPGDDEWENQGVFRGVTESRIRSVVTGVRPDGVEHSAGLEANVVFARLG